jgi:hypothetical protein
MVAKASDPRRTLHWKAILGDFTGNVRTRYIAAATLNWQASHDPSPSSPQLPADRMPTYPPIIMYCMRMIAALTALLASASSIANAQASPQPDRGAWEAARALVLKWPTPPDSARLVRDSTAVRALFERCEGEGSTRRCMITSRKHATLLRVRPITSDSVQVQLRTYEVIQGPCGRNVAGAPLSIEITSGSDFLMVYRESVWIPSGMGRGFAC